MTEIPLLKTIGKHETPPFLFKSFWHLKLTLRHEMCVSLKNNNKKKQKKKQFQTSKDNLGHRSV